MNLESAQRAGFGATLSPNYSPGLVRTQGLISRVPGSGLTEDRHASPRESGRRGLSSQVPTPELNSVIGSVKAPGDWDVANLCHWNTDYNLAVVSF